MLLTDIWNTGYRAAAAGFGDTYELNNENFNKKMNNSDIQNIIRGIVTDLVEGNYQRVYENDYRKRLNAQEIKEGIEDYPGFITLFPDSAFSLMRLYRNTNTNCDIDFPLWYDNERSDLTMVCNIKLINNNCRYTIEDILVQ
jgi:hypothetical protein